MIHEEGAVLRRQLEVQRLAFRRDGDPPAAVRVGRIDRLIEAVVGSADELVAALSADYGHRSPVQSLLADVVGPLPTIEHTRAHVARWMRPARRRSGPLAPLVGRSTLRRDPLGVVGIISPWNFPVTLTATPAAQAFAAGNRVMLKLSEVVPRTSDVLAAALEARFDAEELVAVRGGATVGRAFAGLPLDHLLFTGSVPVGAEVQRAAAANLVPVTLELGGKCPVVAVGGADLRRMGRRVMAQKLLNAGQICLAPDHLYVPEADLPAAVEALVAAASEMYPTLAANPDYTSVVSDAHRRRLEAHVADARAKGATVVEVNPAGEDLRSAAHKMAPTLLVGAAPGMTVMEEEVFGPVLPVLGYRDLEAVLDDIAGRPHPLALYVFGSDRASVERVIGGTRSGGVTVNDVGVHYMVEGLPFGGVGGSGMGRYHGRAGFETFSHARPVVTNRTRFSPNQMVAPPYGRLRRRAVAAGLDLERAVVGRRLAARRRDG